MPARASILSRRGFALLIVLTLLAFLVILLIGLASVTRVETAVAGNTQRQAQARENALLALNLAVAHLQKHAGADQRVTATADALGGTHRHFTGVWDVNGPVTWLVSGNETFNASGNNDPLAINPSTALTTSGANANAIELVGKNSSGSPNDVIAPLVPLRADSVPGTTTTTTIGRYGWWVGDQGVKAPVGVTDSTSSIAYGPYASADLRARIAQQLTTGAGAADGDAAPIFEPRDNNNATLVANGRVATHPQLALLRNSSAAPIGLTIAQQNFQAWSPRNYAVLADTARGGLRQDLSVNPGLLGSAFAAWANYSTYMEDPKGDVVDPTPAISPAYGSDPVRRRYVMQPGTVGGGAVHSVAPVVSYVLLSFNVRTLDGSSAVSPLEVRARWMVSLWNPYTGALVPEPNLRLEVTGLPDVDVINTTAPLNSTTVSLHGAFGAPLKISLPWVASSAADRNSWLPGRVYTWLSLQDNSGTNLPEGHATQFYPSSRNLDSVSGAGVRRAGGAQTMDGNNVCQLQAPGRTLRLSLYAVRSTGDVLLGRFQSPAFVGFTTAPAEIQQGSYQFTYLFRLAESTENPDWLATDLHTGDVPGSAYAVGANGNDPSLYANFDSTSEPDRLFDRAGNARGYDEDIPMFELPRAPTLSLGMLQHLALPGRRPFSIGNSWGATAAMNGVAAREFFDRFFFSGAVANLAPTSLNGSLLLPNPLLRVAPRTGGVTTTIEDLREAPDAQSAKFLLQGGAFNLNSLNTAAWIAILRGVRFPAPKSFTYLDSAFNSGTTTDGDKTAVQSTDARFFRFSQSVQEVYKAEAGYAASTVAPPGDPDPPSAANTHLFRQGMKTLSAIQVSALAGHIVDAIRAHEASLGPFRSLEEFLTPIGGGPSLLEKAIADTGINADASGNPIEFSSQFLTQADIMTALAPVLFARSDTFLVRAYGEAVNPVTGATEGRAWCEATVQRVPEYFDPTNPPEMLPTDSAFTDLNKTYGRRFKVVSFRWLTRSDI